MANIKNMQMAEALFALDIIETRKSFFGLSTRVVYTPTDSPVKLLVLDYSPEEGARLQRLLRQNAAQIAAEVETKGKPKSTQLGSLRAEVALSADHRFAAVQLLSFSDFRYQPLGGALICEGTDAETLARLF